MKKEVFFEQVRSNVERIMKGYQVKLHNVVKANDLELHGLTIVKSIGVAVSPTIYLDEYFVLYIKGNLSIDTIVKEVILLWEKNINSVPMVMENIKDTGNIYLRVLNKYLCTDYLKDAIVKDIDNTNFVLTPYIRFEDIENNHDCNSAITKVTKSLLDFLNLSEQEIFDLALKNCNTNWKVNVKCMGAIIEELAEDIKLNSQIPNKPTMTIVSTDKGTNGATVIFYTDILKQISDKWNMDLIIIPSSIHEVIVFPSCIDSTTEELKNMICSVNKEQLQKDEILDYIPYIYKRENNGIEML